MLSFIATDWEGPWVTNDFAYEVVSSLYSSEFFEKLSSYDDYLSYVIKKPGYNAGWTLKLVAPFIVAKGVTSSQLENLSFPNFISDSQEAIDILKRVRPNALSCVVISTAYIQFLKVSCKKLDINRFYGTEFYPEKYRLPDKEKEILLKASEKVADADFDWLDNFFWNELRNLKSWKIIEDVKVVDSYEKKQIAEKLGAKIAIGDSISDYLMLDFVKNSCGLAISFNGNEYAVRHSNLAIVSDTAISMSVAILAYICKGFEGIKSICEDTSKIIDILSKNSNKKYTNKTFDKEFIERIYSSLEKIRKSEFFLIPENSKDVDEIVETSKKMRIKLRGGAGGLG